MDGSSGEDAVHINRTIAIGVISWFVASIAYSEELPILPSPQHISQLSRPLEFDHTNQQQVTVPASTESQSPRAAAPGNATSAPAASMAIITIDVGKLRAPAQASPRKEVLIVGDPPPAPGPLIVQIGDRKFELAWVAETNEATRAIRHESLQVINVPGGYARFSVSGDEVVGTIVTPQETYRIVPHGPGQQAVFRVSSRDSGSKYERKLMAGSPAAALERRHVQLEKLAEIQPEQVGGSEAGRYLFLRGGRIGKIVGKVDARKTLEAVHSFGDLANAPQDLQVQIASVNAHKLGQQIAFRQLVKGIPYFALNEIDIDKDGNIVGVNTQFVDAGQADDVDLLTAAKAQQQAVKAVESMIKTHLDEYELLKPTELFYYFEPGVQKLIPYYTFYMSAQRADGSWMVRVNAINGDARIMERPQEFGWRACRDNSSSANPKTCSDAGSDVIFYHTYNHAHGPAVVQCPYRQPRTNTICNDDDPNQAMQAMREANVVLQRVQEANPTVCCDRLGGTDHIVDVVYKTTGTTLGGAYDPNTESIMSDPSSDYLRNLDVLWHEFGHHVLYKNAESFSYESTYGKSGEFFTSAFVEAFADLIAAGITMNATPAMVNYGNPGVPWVLPDGGLLPPSIPQRSLADPNITSFYHLSTSADPHEAGRAITKYFYTIMQSSGISAARFMELLVQVSRQMRDVDHNHLDLSDLKSALLTSARSDETALSSAINARFDEMYNNIPGVGSGNPPIGVPVPPNVPPPPYPVMATFNGGCPIVDGVKTSQWRIEWQPSPFAVSYRVFGQQTNGPLNDIATTTGLLVFANTNVPASVSVSACGSNGACGGSSIRVLVNQRPECNL
jgi:hypothetical protein